MSQLEKELTKELNETSLREIGDFVHGAAAYCLTSNDSRGFQDFKMLGLAIDRILDIMGEE